MLVIGDGVTSEPDSTVNEGQRVAIRCSQALCHIGKSERPRYYQMDLVTPNLADAVSLNIELASVEIMAK